MTWCFQCGKERHNAPAIGIDEDGEPACAMHRVANGRARQESTGTSAELVDLKMAQSIEPVITVELSRSQVTKLLSMLLRCAIVAILLCGGVHSSWANTPGQHKVTLSWTASSTSGVSYNIYRGTAAGVCNGTPTPYATGVATTTFTDTTGLNDGQTLYYNVSAVKGGAESACDGEVQVQIPVLPAAPSSLSGSAQ